MAEASPWPRKLCTSHSFVHVACRSANSVNRRLRSTSIAISSSSLFVMSRLPMQEADRVAEVAYDPLRLRDGDCVVLELAADHVHFGLHEPEAGRDVTQFREHQFTRHRR